MIRSLLSAIVLCVCFAACEEPDLVSSDVIPGSDQPGVFFTDTNLAIIFSVQDRPLISNDNSAPLFLGSLNDQAIGLTYASFYIQMRRGASAPLFTSTTTPDSIVLSLGHSSIYGDTTALHTISVYEMLEKIDTVTYYTTQSFQADTNNAPLGSVTLRPSTTESVIVGGVVQAPQLRIRLNNSFAQRLIDNSASLVTDEALLNFFKGLYIKDSTDFNGSGDVKGGILALNSSSSLNTVTLYYKDSPSDTTAKSYSFSLGASSYRSNRVNHSYNAGVLDDSLQTPANLYIQSLGSIQLKVKLPNLGSLVSNGSIAINKAELVLKVKSGTTGVIAPNAAFFAFQDLDNGNQALIYDNLETTYLTFGYPLSSDTYKIDISQHLQRILSGDVNRNYIYIRAGVRGANAQRVVLEGAGSAKFNITYTIKNN
jgi:hypothetical protein